MLSKLPFNLAPSSPSLNSIFAYIAQFLDTTYDLSSTYLFLDIDLATWVSLN